MPTDETGQAAAVLPKPYSGKSRVRWVFSGPFGGKSTLTTVLATLGVLALDTDELRRSLPGWRPELRRAWRPRHPLHAEFRYIDRMHRAQLEKAFRAGAIIIDHNPPPFSLHPFEAAFLRPTPEELERRAASWTIEELTAPDHPPPPSFHDANDLPQPFSRLLAALHYWAKPNLNDWRGLTFVTTDALLDELDLPSERLPSQERG